MNGPEKRRSLDMALADLYAKLIRTPEQSTPTRARLQRMIRELEAEITDRGARLEPVSIPRERAGSHGI